MTKLRWSALACASLLVAVVSGPGSMPANAQGYYQERGRDWDRGRDNREMDRGGRGERRRGGWDEDDRGWRGDRGRFRYEFGGRDDYRRCSWISRRYVDEDGDVVIRRRRVCD